MDLLSRTRLPSKPVKYDRGGGNQASPDGRCSLNLKGGISDPAAERLISQIFVSYDTMPDTLLCDRSPE
jgi:hypothetical protein